MTVRYSSSCPVDHSQDADIVQNFYKTIRSYSLPKIPNVTLQTVHRYEQKTLIKFLSEKREALKKRMDFFHTRGEAGPNPHFYKTVDKRVVFCSVYAVLPFFYPSWLQNYQIFSAFQGGGAHYGGLLRPATPPFLLSPLIPPVFTCF